MPRVSAAILDVVHNRSNTLWLSLKWKNNFTTIAQNTVRYKKEKRSERLYNTQNSLDSFLCSLVLFFSFDSSILFYYGHLFGILSQ